MSPSNFRITFLCISYVLLDATWMREEIYNASLSRCNTMAEIHGEWLSDIGDNDHKIQESEKLLDEP